MFVYMYRGIVIVLYIYVRMWVFRKFKKSCFIYLIYLLGAFLDYFRGSCFGVRFILFICVYRNG